MIDLIDFNETTQDLDAVDTITEKAKNLLTTQLDLLHYALTFGIDLEFYLSPDFQFQNESFKNYLLQRMAENQIDVKNVIDTIESFYEKFTFDLADVKGEGFMR